jgi:hypothetical protein
MLIGNQSYKLLNSGQYRNFYTNWHTLYETHLSNYLLNKKKEQLGLPIYLSFAGDNDYPINVGIEGNNTLEKLLPFIKKFIVVSVTHSYNYAAVSSKIILGGIL